MRKLQMLLTTAGALLLSASAATATNIVINPDFSAGDTGFSSAYTSVSGPSSCTPPAIYSVTTSPAACHPFFSAFGDHTSGAGNMMVINGATTPDVNVWSQSLSVVANTQYYFSAWVASAHPVSPAELNFQINDVAIGSVFTASATTGVWQQFFASWFSGAASSAMISIVNQNTAFSGNDFALDDISLDTVRPDGNDTSVVPEPSTFALAGVAFAALALKGIRRRTRR